MSNNHLHECFRGRSSGVLLHPTSLPAFDDDGGLGDDAGRFLAFLRAAGFGVWQMLPVQSVERYGSPYQAASVHAGNAHFISLPRLLAQYWFADEICSNRPGLFEAVARALTAFERKASKETRRHYEAFRAQQDYWLADYTLFVTLRELNHDKPWWEWPVELRDREPGALSLIARNYRDHIEHYCFEQFLFFSQWEHLHRLAKDHGIMLMGDIPMFPSTNSADVWSCPQYFELDEHKRPTRVAGVPPDYFSASGQRWGNPVYNWERISTDQFDWWIKRFRTQLHLFDILRLDHFRGFDTVWEIPAASTSATYGRWREVPGRELFSTLHQEFGPLPLVAEDLGDITPSVRQLRDQFNLPGMNVLQFAFDGDTDNPYLPHNHRPQDMICTGTHDNDTLTGWLGTLDEAVRTRVQDYLRCTSTTLAGTLIESVFGSVCQLAVLPMQDLLGLDSSHRMNRPGTDEGNWRWRFEWGQVPDELALRMLELNQRYDRNRRFKAIS